MFTAIGRSLLALVVSATVVSAQSVSVKEEKAGMLKTAKISPAAATATAPSRAARASRRGDNGAPPPEVPSADVVMSSPEKPVTARRQWLTSPYQQAVRAEGGGLFEGVEEGI